MPSTLKIAHLTPAVFSQDSYLGGGERYVYNICGAIRLASKEKGFSVNQTIISFGKQAMCFKHGDTPVVILQNISPVLGMVNTVSDGLWDVLGRFDIIHIHQSLTIFGAYCVAIAKSMDLPIVTTDLGGGHEETMLLGKGLELSDGVLSISKYAHSLISSNFKGISRVVIGPIDTDFFSPDCQVKKVKNQVLCVNRILPHKGIDRIIEALPDELSLIVVGQIYNKKYYDLLLRMAKGKNITFISDADDAKLINLYQTSSLFIQASTHVDCYGKKVLKPELMGLTTLEAMSCGLPVIVSDAGSLPELITSGKIGRIFSNKSDLELIFDDYLAGNWPSADQVSLSRDTSTEKYSYISVGNQIYDLYLEVMQTKQTDFVV